VNGGGTVALDPLEHVGEVPTLVDGNGTTRDGVVDFVHDLDPRPLNVLQVLDRVLQMPAQRTGGLLVLPGFE
jgi:hypothetical protein